MKKKLLAGLLAVTLTAGCATPLGVSAGEQTAKEQAHQEQLTNDSVDAVTVPVQNQGSDNIVSSGNCGQKGNESSVVYTLDEDGVLTVFGSGEIGDKAFERRSDIKKVVIDSGVTGIGSYAFQYCTNLSSVEIPMGVVKIGSFAFRGCTNLSSITLPEDLAQIKMYAFSDCESLSRMIIPESVNEIEYGAFQRCKNLSSVIIPGSVKEIENSTFQGCTSLSSVTFSEGVIKIGAGAFSECESISSITIPKSLTSIQQKAFEKCYNLSSIIVDKENPVYDSRENCNAIIETDSNTLLMGCKGTTVVPEGVTKIGKEAFYNCTGLKSIILPESLISIEENAFYQCEDLEGIAIPKNVTDIKDAAFKYCSSLSSLKLQAGIKSLGTNAFLECNIENLFFCGTQEQWGDLYGEISNSHLDEENFWYHDLIKTEEVPATCGGDGTAAYWTCSICKRMYQSEKVQLNPLEITAPITIPATGAHNYTEQKTDTKYLASEATCTEPEKYYYSCSVCGASEKDDTHTFTVGEAKGHCWDSGKVTKEATTQAEGVRTYTCTVCQDTKTEKIAKLKLGTDDSSNTNNNNHSNNSNSNTNKNNNSNSNNSNTNKNNNSNNNQSNTVKKGTKVTVKGYKYTVKNSSEVTFTGVKNKKAKKITIPATVKIKNKKYKVTAMSAKSLKGVQAKTIVIGNNVKTIGNSAMENCKKLTNVTLGKNVTKIGKNALKSDQKLKTITVKSTKLKSVGKNAFKGIHSKAKIKVPAKKYSAYKKLFKGKGQGKKVKIVKGK